MAAVLASLKIAARHEPLLSAFIAVLLMSVAAAAYLESPVPLGVPALLLAAALAVRDLRFVLYTALAFTCLSIEVELGSYGLDVPFEPLAICMLLLGAIYLLARMHRIEAAFLRHPVTLLLALHVIWIAVTAATSVEPIVSLKYFAAKLWYVVPFYFMSALLVRRDYQLHRIVAVVAIPLSVALVTCLVRHAATGFSFESVNPATYIFFRNHVTYAALASILLPLVAISAWDYRATSPKRWGLLLVAVIALAAVQTSYTRAAYVGLIGAGIFVWIIHKRWACQTVAAAAVIAVLASTFIVADGRYFRFAPNYNKTVTQESFNDLVEATYKLEDISTMERVYRWVAGGFMVAERPVLGWGPGTFPRQYKGYGLEAFRTYVSDNEEGSGIHNYFLMVLVEQGWLGLLLFGGLSAAGLLTAERAYHKARTPTQRRAVAMLAASLAVNLSFQLINDMIESDKSGPWFFFSLALLVNLDLDGELRERWSLLEGEE